MGEQLGSDAVDTVYASPGAAVPLTGGADLVGCDYAPLPPGEYVAYPVAFSYDEEGAWLLAQAEGRPVVIE